MLKYVATSVLAMSMAFAGAVFAQDAQTAAPAQGTAATATANHQERGERRFDKMAQKLNLSESQKEQLKPIFAERRQKMQELRASNATKDEKRDQFKQVMADSDAKVKGVLTADQFTQYQQLREQMREHRKERREKKQEQSQAQPQQQ